METQMLIRLVVGLGLTALVLVFAGKRVLWLTTLIRSGQKTSDENNRKDHLGKRITTQFEEVFGQTRLLKWSIPGLAHFFTMWGFFILAHGLHRGLRAAVPARISTSRSSATGTRWASCRTSSPLAVLLGIATFAIIRLRSRAQGIRPRRHGSTARTPAAPG